MEPKIVAENRFVSASYFETMRIPLLAGEVCRETGVSPTHFPALAVVALLVLVVVAAAASLLPSLRASRVEPMQVLREE